jgi:hypothetical protein
MQTVKLHCPACNISVEGKFKEGLLTRLSPELQTLVEEYILASGSIKETEKRLEVSYPYVRARLDKAIDELKVLRQKDEERTHLLDAVERGELAVDEAVEKIRAL